MTRASIIVALLVVCLLAVTVSVQAQNADFVSGVSKVEAGDYVGAVVDLGSAVKAQPGNESAWYYLGVAHFNLKEYPQALEALNHALAIAPQRTGTRLYLGRVYEAQGAYPQAISTYEEEVSKSSGPVKADALVALGRAYVHVGRDKDAVGVLDNALAIDPNYVEAYYYKGVALRGLGKYDEAIATFKAAGKVLEAWSDLKIRLQRLSVSAQRTGGDTVEKMAEKYGKAEQFATELSMWPELNRTLGDTYMDAGKWTEARNAYRHSMHIDEGGIPNNPDANTRIALAYFKDAQQLFQDQGVLFSGVGILKSGINSAVEALAVDPGYAPALRVIGLIYAFQAGAYSSEPAYGLESHTYAEALQQFDRALEADPNYMDALVDEATTYLDWAETLVPGSSEQTGAYDQARALLGRAEALAPESSRTFAQQARLELALESYDSALALADRAVRLEPKNVSALNTEGLACYYQDRLGEAAGFFSEAVAADPKSAQSYVNLANAFFQMQSWFRARREYKNALDRIPDAKAANTAQQRSYLLYLTAITYHETQMYDQEIDTLNQALALDEGYFEALRQLGRAYTEQGKYAAAERALAVARDSAPDDIAEAEVYAQLGLMYERKGDLHAAVLAYSSALGLDPSNVAARQTLERLQS